MSRVQSLIQWDIRRGGDVEVLADLRARPPKERGRRLRELALIGLRAERSGGGLVASEPSHRDGPSPSPAPAPVTTNMVEVVALDDFMGEMLDGLE